FGVMFATVVALVLVPSLYMILEDVRNAWNWLYGKSTTPDPATPSGTMASMGR
ncbi:uncharacterized protein METZ01_LOCUS436685, partial [marine metagenome]